MPAPFLIAQLSDPHVGADWGGADPLTCLEAAVAAVLALDVAPRAVIVSGDLSNNGREEELDAAKSVLDRLTMPYLVLPGNHDDRAALRSCFGLPGEGGEPIQHTAELGPARVVLLDTTKSGSDAGELDAARLEWADRELVAAPDTPTLVAMHHPPLVTGSPGIDEFALAARDREALGAVIRRHPQVRRVIAGHVHRTMVAELGGRPVVAVPSTYMQGSLAFTPGGDIAMVEAQAAIGLHLVTNGEVTSHIHPVT